MPPGVITPQLKMPFLKLDATLNNSLSLVKGLNGYMLTVDKAWDGIHVNKWVIAGCTIQHGAVKRGALMEERKLSTSEFSMSKRWLHREWLACAGELTHAWVNWIHSPTVWMSYSSYDSIEQLSIHIFLWKLTFQGLKNSTTNLSLGQHVLKKRIIGFANALVE